MWGRSRSAGGRSPNRSPPFGGTGSWPLLLLLGAVIVPTVGVLWFMLAAMENERVAVRQRLVTAYRAQLVGVRSQLAASLQQQAARLDGRAEGVSCAAFFAAVLRAGDAVFLGPDAADRFDLGELRDSFSEVAGWLAEARDRHVLVSEDETLAWFDERLESSGLGELRG